MTPNRLAAAMALTLTHPAAADLSYTLINDTSLTLMEFYASPRGEDGWGEDLLHVHVLASGEAASFTIDNNSGPCIYDFRFIMEDGHDRLDRVDVCAGPAYRLEEAR